METKDIIAQLAALAQESRLAVFRLLMQNGQRGLYAGEISEKLGIATNTLSFHLKELQAAGLIQSVRQGRYISYSLHVMAYKDLLKFLTEDCCKGNSELCADNDSCC